MAKLIQMISNPFQPILRLIRRWSIVTKLTLFVGLLVALTAGTLITVGFQYTSEILRDQINNRLSAVADDRQALLMEELLHLEERIRILTTRFRLIEVLNRHVAGTVTPERFRSEATQPLDNVRADTEGLLAFWIEDQNGRVIAASGPQPLLDLFGRNRKAKPVTERDPELIGFPRATGQTYAALFRTAARARGRRDVGSLLLVMDLGPMMSALADPRRLGETGEVLVGIRDQETMRYLFPPRLTPAVTDYPANRTPAMNRAVSGEYGFMRTLDRLNRDVLAAFRPVGYEDWGLVAKMDVDEAYAPVNRLRRLLLAIGGLILTPGPGRLLPDRSSEHPADPQAGRDGRRHRPGQPGGPHRRSVER